MYEKIEEGDMFGEVGALCDIPQHDTSILRSPSSVFPCLPGQLRIDGAPISPIRPGAAPGHPRVDDQTGAGLEWVGQTLLEAAMEGIEQGGGGDLRCGLGGSMVLHCVRPRGIRVCR